MFQRRVKILLIVYALAVVTVLGRVVWLQARGPVYPWLEGEEVERGRPVDIQRGYILDRTGKPENALAREVPVYQVTIRMYRFTQLAPAMKDRFILDASRLMGWTPEQFKRRLREIEDEIGAIVHKDLARRISLDPNLPPTERQQRELIDALAWQRRKPHPLYETAGTDQASEFAFICRLESRLDGLPKLRVHGENLPVLSTDARFERVYPQGKTACHLAGYLSKIHAGEYQAWKISYAGDQRMAFHMDDRVGRAGLESVYNALLRGRRGRTVYRTFYDETTRRRTEVVDDKTIYPQRGNDLRLNLDLRLQAVAERELKNRRGAVVAMDCTNGEVLAMATWPRYDPEQFRHHYKRLLEDPDKPLLNRAIQGVYAPGSTFKVMTSLVALREADEIGYYPTRDYDCAGSIMVGNHRVHCHGGHVHGDTDMRKALKVSCNTYYASLGLRLNRRLFDRAKSDFLIGHRAGIDLPGESAGLFRPPQSSQDAGMVGFGQGPVAATPLQMAMVMSALANGGKLYRPHLVTEAGKDYLIRDLTKPPWNYSPRVFQRVHEGLVAAVAEPGGTGYSIFRGCPVSVAGKTGTASTPTTDVDGKYHTWFVCYAPVEAPRVVVVAMVENQHGYGGTVAGPIARALIEEGYKNGWLPPIPIEPNPPCPETRAPYPLDENGRAIVPETES